MKKSYFIAPIFLLLISILIYLSMSRTVISVTLGPIDFPHSKQIAHQFIIDSETPGNIIEGCLLEAYESPNPTPQPTGGTDAQNEYVMEIIESFRP